MSSVRTAAAMPARRLQGHLRVPGDKSISHRKALIPALSRGRSELRNYAPGADYRSTHIWLAALGVDVSVIGCHGYSDGTRAAVIPFSGGHAPLTIHERPTTPTHDTQGIPNARLTAIPTSGIRLEDVGRNPTRTALIEVLRKIGEHVDLRETANAVGEPIGTIIVAGGRTGSIHIQPHEIPELLDELPAIAALAAHSGEVRVDGARAVRVKESERITALVAGLGARGIQADKLETLDRLVA